MKFTDMKTALIFLALGILLLLAPSCKSGRGDPAGNQEKPYPSALLADDLEESLFNDILQPWYPLILDTVYGGYISDLNYDWTPAKSPQVKALVQQARHVWSTSFIYEHYPGKKEFLDYAAHGFRFLEESLWDSEYGGFHAFCNKDGSPVSRSIDGKRIYGQAFAVYALSQYYRISHDEDALPLAKEAFLWMEERAHDHQFGGYFEIIKRDGSPVMAGDIQNSGARDAPATGLKDYNSSIHLMEAFTELYRIWPDSLVRSRLEEMFYLIRDTFVHPDGYLQLYFYPDWKLVPDQAMEERSGGNHWFTQHFTYGHDVETAFLLLETAHVLGWGEDEKTRQIAKKLVDHSLESGWDNAVGGFFNAGKQAGEEIRIIDNKKSWWSQAEGLNALLMMHSLYQEDPQDYFGLAVKMWEYLDTYQIDKKHGGWYNYGLDITPTSATQRKSHAWKTTYHNVRGLVNSIQLLKSI